MKRVFNEAEYQGLIKKLDELSTIEKEQAEAVLQEAFSYIADTDLSRYPSEECALYRGIAFFYINNRDVNRACDILLKAQAIALAKGTNEDKMRVESALAIIHSIRGENLEAVDIWEDILSQIDSSHPLYWRILNNLVVAYGFNNQFAKAVDLSYKLLQTLEETNAPTGMLSSAYINLGNSYTPLKKYDQAIKAFEHALELSGKIGHYSHQNSIHGNLVGIYTDLGDLEKAYYHCELEYETSQKMPGNIQIAEALSRMGDVCHRMGRFAQSEEYLLKALEILRIDPNPVSIADCLMSLGKLYMAKGEREKAIAYLNEAEPYIQSTSVQQLNRTYYLAMNSYYLSIQDYQKAHECLYKLLELNDTEFAQLSENMISVAEAEYLRHQIEKQNQAYQAQNKELQRSVNMLNRLISILSHDVRGPAANSAHALRLIQEGTINGSTSQELLGHVIDNLEGMEDLLAEMLLWIESRAFSKDVSRLMQNVNLPELLNSVIKYYQGQIAQKEIRLQLELPDSPLMSYSEPNILKTVMRNILSNAIKYSHKGDSIYISLALNTDSIVLKIKDQGIGMEAEELNKLISEDAIPRAGTNQEIGMGMGMRLCFSYLKILNIAYDISSRVHEGTEFILRLPLAKADD